MKVQHEAVIILAHQTLARTATAWRIEHVELGTDMLETFPDFDWKLFPDVKPVPKNRPHRIVFQNINHPVTERALRFPVVAGYFRTSPLILALTGLFLQLHLLFAGNTAKSAYARPFGPPTLS